MPPDTYSSHGQVIGAFNREFIKTAIFPKEYASVIQALFDDRQIGDYGIFVKISKSTAQKHINKAKNMIEAVHLKLLT
ncbi:MAG: HEPN domain-containing protein [Chitinivibrionales bacterium]